MLDLYENSTYILEFDILDLNTDTCYIEVTSNIPTVSIEAINRTTYKINTLFLDEMKDYVIGKISITVTNEYEISNTFEEYIRINRNVYYYTYIKKITKELLEKYVDKEELVWHDILRHSRFERCNYNDFKVANSVDEISPNVTYDYMSSSFYLPAGEYLIVYLINGSVEYSNFMGHVKVDNIANIKLEYSINDTNVWHFFEGDTVIRTDSVFTSMKVKITALDDVRLYGMGIFYKSEDSAPNITNVKWSSAVHYISNTYDLTIEAEDPNNLPLTYQVTCSDPNVTITQDLNDDRIFHISYPENVANSILLFLILISNSNGLADLTSSRIYLNTTKAPIVEKIVWDHDIQYEQNTYTVQILMVNN